jgi:hypothetical protein
MIMASVTYGDEFFRWRPSANFSDMKDQTPQTVDIFTDLRKYEKLLMTASKKVGTKTSLLVALGFVSESMTPNLFNKLLRL